MARKDEDYTTMSLKTTTLEGLRSHKIHPNQSDGEILEQILNQIKKKK